MGGKQTKTKGSYYPSREEDTVFQKRKNNDQVTTTAYQHDLSAAHGFDSRKTNDPQLQSKKGTNVTTSIFLASDIQNNENIKGRELNIDVSRQNLDGISLDSDCQSNSEELEEEVLNTDSHAEQRLTEVKVYTHSKYSTTDYIETDSESHESQEVGVSKGSNIPCKNKDIIQVQQKGKTVPSSYVIKKQEKVSDGELSDSSTQVETSNKFATKSQVESSNKHKGNFHFQHQANSEQLELNVTKQQDNNLGDENRNHSQRRPSLLDKLKSRKLKKNALQISIIPKKHGRSMSVPEIPISQSHMDNETPPNSSRSTPSKSAGAFLYNFNLKRQFSRPKDDIISPPYNISEPTLVKSTRDLSKYLGGRPVELDGLSPRDNEKIEVESLALSVVKENEHIPLYDEIFQINETVISDACLQNTHSQVSNCLKENMKDEQNFKNNTGFFQDNQSSPESPVPKSNSLCVEHVTNRNGNAEFLLSLKMEPINVADVLDTIDDTSKDQTPNTDSAEVGITSTHTSTQVGHRTQHTVPANLKEQRSSSVPNVLTEKTLATKQTLSLSSHDVSLQIVDQNSRAPSEVNFNDIHWPSVESFQSSQNSAFSPYQKARMKELSVVPMERRYAKTDCNKTTNDINSAVEQVKKSDHEECTSEIIVNETVVEHPDKSPIRILLEKTEKDFDIKQYEIDLQLTELLDDTILENKTINVFEKQNFGEITVISDNTELSSSSEMLTQPGQHETEKNYQKPTTNCLDKVMSNEEFNYVNVENDTENKTDQSKDIEQWVSKVNSEYPFHRSISGSNFADDEKSSCSASESMKSTEFDDLSVTTIEGKKNYDKTLELSASEPVTDMGHVHTDEVIYAPASTSSVSTFTDFQYIKKEDGRISFLPMLQINSTFEKPSQAKTQVLSTSNSKESQKSDSEENATHQGNGGSTDLSQSLPIFMKESSIKTLEKEMDNKPNHPVQLKNAEDILKYSMIKDTGKDKVNKKGSYSRSLSGALQTWIDWGSKRVRKPLKKLKGGKTNHKDSYNTEADRRLAFIKDSLDPNEEAIFVGDTSMQNSGNHGVSRKKTNLTRAVSNIEIFGNFNCDHDNEKNIVDGKRKISVIQRTPEGKFVVEEKLVLKEENTADQISSSQFEIVSDSEAELQAIKKEKKVKKKFSVVEKTLDGRYMFDPTSPRKSKPTLPPLRPASLPVRKKRPASVNTTTQNRFFMGESLTSRNKHIKSPRQSLKSDSETLLHNPENLSESISKSDTSNIQLALIRGTNKTKPQRPMSLPAKQRKKLSQKFHSEVDIPTQVGKVELPQRPETRPPARPPTLPVRKYVSSTSKKGYGEPLRTSSLNLKCDNATQEFTSLLDRKTEPPPRPSSLPVKRKLGQEVNNTESLNQTGSYDVKHSNHDRATEIQTNSKNINPINNDLLHNKSEQNQISMEVSQVALSDRNFGRKISVCASNAGMF